MSLVKVFVDSIGNREGLRFVFPAVTGDEDLLAAAGFPSMASNPMPKTLNRQILNPEP